MPERITFTSGGTAIRMHWADSWTTTSTRLCPDLLTLDAIGAADNLRGRVVRAFFKLMELWPVD